MMPKHHDRRHDDVQWAQEPRPDGVGNGAVSGGAEPAPGLGPASGGGLGLVAAWDMASAAEEAQFMLSEVRLGLIPAVISPFVVAAIGERQARRYFLTAERISATEAARIGLVHRVVAADALDDAVDTVLGHLAKAGPQALGLAKDLIHAVAGKEIDDSVTADTARRIADARAGPEGREGVSAFLEKRKPNWV